MKEFELKYGCNPNQKPAKIYMKDGSGNAHPRWYILLLQQRLSISSSG